MSTEKPLEGWAGLVDADEPARRGWVEPPPPEMSKEAIQTSEDPQLRSSIEFTLPFEDEFSAASVDRTGFESWRERKGAPSSSWRDYRGPILTVAAVLVLLASSIALTKKWNTGGQRDVANVRSSFHNVQSKPPSEPRQTQRARAGNKDTHPNTQPNPSVSAASIDVPNSTPKSSPPNNEAPPRTRVPMISILSAPSGALVEIDGVIYGKTPFIAPAPSKLERLALRLHLDGYKKWEEELLPNEIGHFTLRAELEKL